MSKCTTVHQLFKKVHDDLGHHYNTRQHYYIAGDLLRLLEQCEDSSFIDGKEDFTRTFNAALYYFLKTSRLDDAERIFRAGFYHKNLGEIVFSYRERMVKSGKATDILVFPVYLDRLLSFFAQIGKEGEVLELEYNFSERQVPRLANLAAISWTRLTHTFLTGHPDKDHFPLCQRMNKLSKDYIKSDFRQIILDEKSDYSPIIKNKKLINLQAWLLKRQMLGIYAGICAYLPIPTGDRLEEEREELLFNNLSQLSLDVVETYAYLVHYTVNGYLYAAIHALENCTKDGYKPQWYGDVIDNLRNQLEYTRYRHAEVTDFFKETLDLPFHVTYPDKLITALNKVGIKEMEKKSPEQQLDGLKTLIPEHADKKNLQIKCGLKEEQETMTLPELKNKIEIAVKGAAFKEFCRKRFTFPRLKVLAVSLDNLYSTGSAFFFQNHGIRTEETRKIDTELCIMKKWGSTGGMFQRERYINTSYGGGFFLFHNGFGLAMDPGPDFLKLLVQNSDYDLMDINGVVCSHPHRDHSAEFSRILAGVREYNRSAGFKRLYYLFPHEEDGDIIYPGPLREEFAVDVSTDSEEKDVYFFPTGQWGRGHGIRVQSLPVTHRIHKDRENSYGLLVSPLKDGEPLVNILFSGDARYRPGLFESIDAKYKPDVLVLNIASTLIHDITALEPGAHLAGGGNPPEENHLGYAGVQSILNRLHGYRAAVINEFYEVQSLLDGRLLIANALKNDTHKTAGNGNPLKNIFCVEPGLRFRFKTGGTGDKNQIGIFCSHLCNDSENGFVSIPEAEIEQFKSNLSSRRTPVLTACQNCARERKNLFGIG